MLDIKLVRENPDIIRKDIIKRDMPSTLAKFEELIELDKKWRAALQETEELKRQRNVITAEVAKLKKEGKDITAKLHLVKEIPGKIKELDERTIQLRMQEDEILMNLPNILHESVPLGVDDTQNKVEKTWGEKKKYSFTPKSHVDILAQRDFGDTEKAGEISGARFYYLKRELVLLDIALQKFTLDHMHQKGYILMEPPFLMRRKPYEGVTSLADFENVMYKIEGEDLYLIATSEHPIGAYHMNEVVESTRLPLKYAGISPCFRKEAGSHGKDTKGIFRVHHFNKIEQFVFCKPEESWQIHEELMKNAEEIVQKLGLHYRIVNVCTGDIGTVAAKKYDLEVWMPVQNAYREMMSCSNCTDYQARRLGIKYSEGAKRDFLHTLNSTALATSRAIVALIENCQDEKGYIHIPHALQLYMGGMKKI
ncbi:MAG: serine--tRNA ligase [archaeon]